MEAKIKKVVLLDKPIWLAIEDNPEEDIRKVVEVCGFNVLWSDTDSKKIIGKEIETTEQYIEHLCGVSKWQSEGNHYYDDEWLARTGEIYPTKCYMVREYCRKARQEKRISWCLFDTSKKIDDETEGVLCEDFIISKTLANNIREFGKVDVQF
ncbi:hypothetical protein [Sodaliphilus pleomorphus]|uniref:Uncharacterized protein n=1 Tax=Sodaliphilus pleomorphus TaxID=2606626 RepID=A0A6L5XGW1_9BACT|nr:hypothetical protein [Sodaliphilus pleomorphus]MSS18767.1 hypothetical protein [Sodaliphilus pleomorphus]